MHEHTSYFISVLIHFSVLHLLYLLYSQREKVLFLKQNRSNMAMPDLQRGPLKL